MHYENEKGEIIIVATGLGQPPTFGAFRINSRTGGKHRVKSKNLPMRANRDEAEEDLQRYAEKHGWKRLVVLEVKVLGKRDGKR